MLLMLSVHRVATISKMSPLWDEERKSYFAPQNLWKGFSHLSNSWIIGEGLNETVRACNEPVDWQALINGKESEVFGLAWALSPLLDWR